MYGIDDKAWWGKGNFSLDNAGQGRDSGFLLIEALIAMAIVSLAFVAVLQIAEISTKRHRNADAVRDAFMQAQSVLRRTVNSSGPASAERIDLGGDRAAQVSIRPVQFNLGIAAATGLRKNLILVDVEVVDANDQVLASLQSIKADVSSR